MVQEQLVEYIKSQLKLGVPRDAVKAALLGAGWVGADVEDTLKKVENDMRPPAAVSPVQAGPMGAPTGGATGMTGMPNVTRGTNPIMIGGSAETRNGPGMSSVSTGAKPGGSPSMRISDLISANASPASSPSVSSSSKSETSFLKGFQKGDSGKGATVAASPVMLGTAEALVKRNGSGGGSAKTVIFIILIILFAGAAGYFFYQNMTLSSKVGALGGQTGDVASQLAALTAQVQTLDASNTALMGQVGSLSSQNIDLVANLSFLTTIPGASSTTPITIMGALSEKKPPTYTFTTLYGLMVTIKNSTDPAVVSALKPLLSSTSAVSLTGTHLPGSLSFTVTAVNGSPITAAATTTASTTSP